MFRAYLKVYLLLCLFNIANANELEYTGLLFFDNGAVATIDNGDLSSHSKLSRASNSLTDNFIKEAFLPDRLFFSNNVYEKPIVALKYRGLFQFNTNNDSWNKLASLKKRVVSFDSHANRRVQGIAYNAGLILHKHDVLFKVKNRYITLKTNLGSSKYLTALAYRDNKLYIGTSVNGLYVAKFNPNKYKKNHVVKFVNRSKGLPYIAHSKRVFMYEEISVIYISDKSELFIGTSIQGGVYYKSNAEKRFQRLQWLFQKDTPLDVFSISASDDELWVGTSKGLLIGKKTKGQLVAYEWQKISRTKLFGSHKVRLATIYNRKKNLTAQFFNHRYLTQDKINRRKNILKKRLFYTSGYNFYRKKLPNIKYMLKRKRFNGLVIDVKGDGGYVRYHSKVKFVKKINALRPKYNLKKLIKLVKKYNAYLVARVVVFQDPVLYRQKGYAILNRYTKKKWVGNKLEHWVDPFNENLAEQYYIPLVRELESLGVDEIQLDYIRFPSDGGVGSTYFSHRKNKDIYYSEALESFLNKIRRSTRLPIGVDVYGYHGIYRASGVIGQDIDAFSSHVDVVAPMLYSSHFGNSYLTKLPRSKRAYNLLKHCALRSLQIAQDNYIIRPYLQAFPMKASLWGYGAKYFNAQIKGGFDNGIKGFMFWGAIHHLRKVERALPSYND